MWLQLGGSLVAILVLAGIARALGLGGNPLGDDETVRSAAAEFVPAGAIVRIDRAGDGAAALAWTDDGRVVVLKRHGAQVAARIVAADSIERRPDGWRAVTGERRFGDVTVRGA